MLFSMVRRSAVSAPLNQIAREENPVNVSPATVTSTSWIRRPVAALAD